MSIGYDIKLCEAPAIRYDGSRGRCGAPAFRDGRCSTHLKITMRDVNNAVDVILKPRRNENGIEPSK